MFRNLFRTARWRMVGWNVLIMTLFLVVLGGSIYGLFSTRIYIEGDQQLNNEQAIIENKFQASSYDPASVVADSQISESSFRTIFAATNGEVLATNDCAPTTGPIPPPCLPEAFSLTSRASLHGAMVSGHDIRTVGFRHTPNRVLTFKIEVPGSAPPYYVQISHDASGEEGALRELRALLVFGGLLGILLAAAGSIFLADRALVPIRQAFSRQRQFTADASHELRTPLALIRANAETLARREQHLRPQDAEFVHEIIRETEHLNRLIGDLLTLARADSDPAGVVSTPVDFRKLVSNVHEDLQLIAESRGISSMVSLDGPVAVPGDEVRLRQLLLILLDNALKYTDPGGRVDVSLARVDHRARLVVSDTGIGIPSEDVAHIFERFYRVDQAREHESGGTGLGLAIANWIVQSHHGTIKVDSAVGKGTKFQVDLPVA